MSKKLKLLHLNVRSLRNKLHLLESLLREENYKDTDVVALSETWIYDSETEFMNLPDYNSVFKCRENNRGGGLAVYVKNNISFKEIHHQRLNRISETEVLTIEIQNADPKIKITTIYKPPQADNNEFLQSLENLLVSGRHSHIVVGDTNIDLLKNNQAVENYISVIETNGYRILNRITESAATRITDTTASIIDHAISNVKGSASCSVGENTFSDHNTLLVHVDVNITLAKMDYYMVKKIDYEKVKQSINNKIGDIEGIEQLTTLIESTLKQNTNYKRLRTRGHLWITH